LKREELRTSQSAGRLLRESAGAGGAGLGGGGRGGVTLSRGAADVGGAGEPENRDKQPTHPPSFRAHVGQGSAAAVEAGDKVRTLSRTVSSGEHYDVAADESELDEIECEYETPAGWKVVQSMTHDAHGLEGTASKVTSHALALVQEHCVSQGPERYWTRKGVWKTASAGDLNSPLVLRSPSA
jgi:hypothetical protein